MIKAKKSLSQNFLIDKNIANKIINQGSLRNKTVLEIGPGYGILTDIIIKKNPKYLYLIEKDNKLSKKLKEKYIKNNNIIIINEDILNFNFKKLNNLIIISNLPYNISSRVILYLFRSYKQISSMIFMLQKEVAIKFDYNLGKMNKYKFFTKMYSDYERCFNVTPNVFYPKPKVNSTVVTFKMKKKDINYDKINKFIKKIFLNKRKKIFNNLNIKISKNNLLLNKRVDEISIEELLDIYNFF